MNCSQVRQHLADHLTQDLTGDQATFLKEHLQRCASCQNEELALRSVLNALESAPAGDASVNFPRLYHQAAIRQKQQIRRWRRFGVAAAAAAAVLLLFCGLRLNVQLNRHQIVLRWGPPPAAKKPAGKPDGVAPEKVQPAIKPAAISAQDLELMKQLIHALAADIDRVEHKYDKEILQLFKAFTNYQSLTESRWDAARHQLSVLYTAQFGFDKKGAKQ